MGRVETFGNCTLHLGDAREIVPGLQPVDLVVTDAPYLLTSGGAARGDSGHNPMRGGWMADYGNSGAVVTCDIGWPEIMSLIGSALAADGEAYVMANDKNVGPLLEAATASGLRLHNLLVWDKVTATANRWYMKNCEFTAYLFTGRARKIADCSAKQLVRMSQRDESDHPTEKPVQLMAHYIAMSCPPGGVVLDPFMGSGTTGVAAVRQGRKFIGIEIEERHFDTACRRVEAAVQAGRGDLFANGEAAE